VHGHRLGEVLLWLWFRDDRGSAVRSGRYFSQLEVGEGQVAVRIALTRWVGDESSGSRSADEHLKQPASAPRRLRDARAHLGRRLLSRLAHVNSPPPYRL